MKHSKINMGSLEVAVGEVLLKIDPVFLYNIPNKFIEDNVHKASAWNISAPDWHGKLLVIKTETGDDCCQCQFRNTDGALFGVAVITKSDFSSSRAFQKVRDSRRYCTQEIQNIVSGDSAVYGVGFLNSEPISQLIHCLQQYFRIGSQNNETSVGVGGDETNRCTELAQVKTEVTDGLTEDIDLKYTHRNTAQVDMQDETMTTSIDPKYTEHAQVKVEVDDETEHAQITADVENETAHAPIMVEIEGKTAHAPIDVEANDKAAHDTPNLEASDDAAHARINVKVEDETAHAPINVGAKDKTTRDRKCTAHARIKVEVDYDTEHAQINMDVEEGTAHAPINAEASDEVTHAPIHVEVEDETAHAPIKLEVNDETAHAPSKESVKVRKNTSICVTQERGRVSDPNSGIDPNAFHLYYDSKTKCFTCHLCSYAFKTPSINQLNFLLIHWASSHNIKKPQLCKLCYLVFPSQELRAQHIEISIHKICSFCLMEFYNEDALQSHVKDLHQQDVNNSNNLTSTEPEAWTWMRFQDRDTKELTCPFCPEPLTFPSERRVKFLFTHFEEVHHLSEPPTCRLCYVIFSTADLRSKHIEDLHKVCHICSMEFAKYKSLNRHLKLVHDSSPTACSPSVTPVENKKLFNFPCSSCSREFKKMLDLNNHVNRVHNSNSTSGITVENPPKKENRRFHCRNCSKTFRKGKHLKKHNKHTHNSNSNSTPSIEIPPKKAKLSYGCSICSVEFENGEDLHYHGKQVHNSNSKTPSVSVEKPAGLSCSICSLKFSTKMHLQFHYEGHLGQPNDEDVEVVAILPNEKDFEENSCKVCKRSFGNEKALEEHLIRAHYERKLGQSVSECVPSAPLVPVTNILPSIPEDLLGIVHE